MNCASMCLFHRVFVAASSVLLLAAPIYAQEPFSSKAAGATRAKSSAAKTNDLTPANVLTSAQWRRVDTAVGRAHTWLINRQQPDGSFPTLNSGQPGVTSLCMMAFIAHGHV